MPEPIGTASAAQAKQLALWAVLGAAALTSVSAWLSQGRVSARVPTATWIAAIILTAAAEVAPKPASGFAVLVLVTSVVVTGPNVWRQLADRMAGPRFPDEDTDIPPGEGRRGRAQQPPELRDQPRGGRTFA